MRFYRSLTLILRKPPCGASRCTETVPLSVKGIIPCMHVFSAQKRFFFAINRGREKSGTRHCLYFFTQYLNHGPYLKTSYYVRYIETIKPTLPLPNFPTSPYPTSTFPERVRLGRKTSSGRFKAPPGPLFPRLFSRLHAYTCMSSGKVRFSLGHVISSP